MATTGALAECSGLLGTGSRALDIVVHENSEGELPRDFPGQSDAENIGCVEIRRRPQFDSEGSIPSLRFTFNTNIDPSSFYKPDQFTAAFATPNIYFDQHDQLTYLVSLSTRSDSFNTYYQRAWGGTAHWQFVMDMDDTDFNGIIQFPFAIRDP